MVNKHSKTFHLHGGKKFNTLKGLAKELTTISHESFTHHVNETKHDFANWIKNSLKNKNLGERVEKRLNKIEVELEILRHLVHGEDAPKKKSPAKKVAIVKKVVAEKILSKKIVKKTPAKVKIVKKKVSKK